MGVAYSTSYIRIVYAANQTKRRYKPFTEADVTQDMKATELRVYAPAWVSASNKIVSPDIVILEGGRKDSIIQPTNTEEMSEEFQNLFGASREGHSMVATFPLSVLQEGNEIRVVWDIGKEMSHKFNLKNMR